MMNLVHVPRPLVRLVRALLAGEDQRFGVGTAEETSAKILPTFGLELQNVRIIIACERRHAVGRGRRARGCAREVPAVPAGWCPCSGAQKAACEPDGYEQ